MMQKLKSMLNDDRGVSPVIGVILMVAITVILAAVIGTFVLGLGDSLGDSTPQASLSIADDPNDFDAGATSGNESAYRISHQGGDSISGEEVRITIRNASSNQLVAEWDDGNWDTNLNASLNGGNFATDDSLTPGDRITISEVEPDNNNVLSDNTRYEVSVTYKPSGERMASSTVLLE